MRGLPLALTVASWLLATEPGSLAARAETRRADPQAVPAGPRVTAEPRVVAALSSDTVAVGEPFVLGLTVLGEGSGRVRFPPVLTLPENLEQRGPVEVRIGEGDGTRRAYYRLVAWKAGRLEFPALEFPIAATGSGRSVSVHTPTLSVRSVLPSNVAGLELKEAKPYLDLGGWPWVWILLALLAVVLAAWWWWRRRRREGAVAVPESASSPAEHALRELRALGARWKAEEISAPRFYDELERALREYAEVTRAWSPGAPLRGLANGDAALAQTLELSALARFARVGVQRKIPLEATAVAAAWVEADWTVASGEAEPGPAGPESDETSGEGRE